MPEDLTDDQIAERIADEVSARLAGRQLTPRFLRRLVRLYTRQALGLESPPGAITHAALGEHLGLAPQRVSETEARALARAWRAYQTQFPDLL